MELEFLLALEKFLNESKSVDDGIRLIIFCVDEVLVFGNVEAAYLQ